MQRRIPARRFSFGRAARASETAAARAAAAASTATANAATATAAADVAHGDGSAGRTPQQVRRQAIGLVAGLALAALVYLGFPESAAEQVNAAHAASDPDSDTVYTAQAMRITAAVTILMGVWWMTEAVPLAVTALVPLVAFPLLQISPFGELSVSYAEPTLFLFMGGFILALGMQRWNLHRRLALVVVLLVGTKPRQLIAGFMIATGFLSMWVNNTATAVVMVPIGVSVLQLTAETVGGMRQQRRFAIGLMLAIAYAASIGSLGTLIGTAPNALFAAYMASSHDVHIGFGQWMLVCLPLSIVFLAITWAVLVTVFRPEVSDIPGGRDLIRRELAQMGRMSAPEVIVAAVFATAALAWIFVPLIIDALDVEITIADAAIGLTAALLLFLLPGPRAQRTRLMDWQTANELPWGVLLLIGGGLALSKMISGSGLSLWIGELAQGFEVLPTVLLIAAVVTVVLVLTEFTSNTATAATFLPILAGVATGIGLDGGGAAPQNILLLTIPVTLAATCAFVLPVATPPNAIVFGSGYVTIADMARGGIWLNLLAIPVVTATVYLLAVPVFGLVL